MRQWVVKERRESAAATASASSVSNGIMSISAIKYLLINIQVPVHTNKLSSMATYSEYSHFVNSHFSRVIAEVCMHTHLNIHICVEIFLCWYVFKYICVFAGIFIGLLLLLLLLFTLLLSIDESIRYKIAFNCVGNRKKVHLVYCFLLFCSLSRTNCALKRKVCRGQA